MRFARADAKPIDEMAESGDVRPSVAARLLVGFTVVGLLFALVVGVSVGWLALEKSASSRCAASLGEVEEVYVTLDDPALTLRPLGWRCTFRTRDGAATTRHVDLLP